MPLVAKRNCARTFTFGRRHEEAFGAHFRGPVVDYCARHGYDFRQVTEPLDGFRAATRAGGVLAQKLLVAAEDFAAGYDAVVWLDSDVYVAPHAPSIAAACPEGKICGANQAAQLNRRARLFNQITRGYERTAREWYADRGVAFDSEDVLQSGVLVFWPRSHGALCREVYDAITRSDAYRRHGEDQPFFSREFLRRGLVHFLDWEFNAVWDLHHNFVAVRPDDRGDKVELMARLLFVANFVHFTSLADVDLLPEARRGYDDLAARAACEGACAA